MDGMLSQNEINALLNDMDDDSEGERLSDVERDAVGEIANISMGTAATTLFSLVNQRVEISTPVVTPATWDDIVDNYERPSVFIRIAYTVGLDGSNILVLKEHDVKIITDLMMGGDGTNTEGDLSELHLSAISEAMNQMMGSAATSLSSMLDKTIDISPPKADLVDFNATYDEANIDSFLAGEFVKISFKLEIGDLIDSEIMQLYPYSFAREMYQAYCKSMGLPADGDDSPAPAPAQAQPQPEPAPAPTPAAAPPPAPTPPPQAAPQMGMPMGQPMGMPMGQPMYYDPNMMAAQQVNVQPAQFQPLMGDFNPLQQQENIDLIMDVPLDVTVELGRTTKSIQEILEFNPGTIIELDKIAGEPIDVLVNGKYVAKGEVVVIEESFGVRITEIIKD